MSGSVTNARASETSHLHAAGQLPRIGLSEVCQTDILKSPVHTNMRLVARDMRQLKRKLTLSDTVAHGISVGS